MALPDVPINSYVPQGRVRELDPNFVRWLADNFDWVKQLKQQLDSVEARLTAIGG